jgi:hypothetical protein
MPALRHTNGGLSACAQANDQGTFTDTNSTVPGQAVTVRSDVGSKDGVPMEIDTTGSVQVLDALTQSTLGKRFRVFIAPALDKGFNNYCFQLIGQGVSFCTVLNCATTHHHGSVKSVKPREVYVAKGPTMAFVTPSLTPMVIDEQVLENWKSLNLALPDWNEKFLITAAALDDLPASAAAMEVQEDFFRNKALTFKTPVKAK